MLTYVSHKTIKPIGICIVYDFTIFQIFLDFVHDEVLWDLIWFLFENVAGAMIYFSI